MNSRTPSMFSNRTIGFYLGLAAGVMAIVSLVAYAMYAVAAGSYNVWVIAPLVLVVLAQAATIPLDNDWLIAVTDNEQLILGHYNELDTGVIEQLLQIFRRVNRMDEKEQKQKNLLTARKG